MFLRGQLWRERTVGRVDFLDVETVWNELTSVIPRIEMIARLAHGARSRRARCIVQYDTERKRNIRSAPFQAEPVRLPSRGSRGESNIRKIWPSRPPRSRE